MRCERARELLSQARYAQDADLPELRAHVAECAACRALEAHEIALDRMLALDEPATPRPGFDTRFFARLEHEKARVQRGHARRRLVWALLPLCAGALAVLLIRPRVATLPAPGSGKPPQSETAPALPGPIEPDDLSLAMDLELVEDIDVVQQLDALEDYDVLSQVDADELERAAKEPP